MSGRWPEWFRFAQIRKRRFYVKWVLVSLLLTVAPLLVSNIVAYVQASRTFEEDTQRNKAQYLSQTTNAVDIVVNQIKENLRHLVLEDKFRQFEQYANGPYLEKLQGDYSPYDLYELYYYLQNKNEVLSSISVLKVSNSFIHSVYFYDRSKDLVMTAEASGTNRQFEAGQFFDTGWMSALQRSTIWPIVLDPRMAPQPPRAAKRVMTMIYKSTFQSNVIVINIDADKLHDQIIGKLNMGDDVVVVSEGGEPLLYRESTPYLADIRRMFAQGAWPAAATGSLGGKFGDEAVLVTYAKSEALGWRFVTVTPTSSMLSYASYYKSNILLSVIVLVGLSIVFSYVSSHRLYQPIARIYRLLKSRSDSRHDYGDEMKFIGSAVQTTLVERDQYKERLEEHLPTYREQFKAGLLRAPARGIEEILDKAAGLKLELPVRELAVLVLGVDGGPPPDPEEERLRLELDKLQIRDVLERSGLVPFPFFVADMDQNRLALVVHVPKEQFQRVFQVAQELIDRLSREMERSLTFGVGRFCADIGELPRAYREAAEALNYRMVFGSGQVIYVEDVLIGSIGDYRYPKEREELLIGCVKTGNEEEALRIFEDMIANIRDTKAKLHYNQIRLIFVQLLTALLHALDEAGANLDRLFGDSGELYRIPLGGKPLEEKARWFRGLVRQAARCFAEEMSHRGNHHVEKVLDLIREEYGQDVNLNTVADRLDLNPAYISRLFKQMTGKTFVEYVREYRIEQGKELLRTTSATVNDVARRVGYQNPHYFIKVFKDFTGLTPGEFRKLFPPA